MSEGEFRLSDVELDESIGRASPDVEHERAVAIFDLLEENHFKPVGHAGGPYKLTLSIIEMRSPFARTRVRSSSSTELRVSTQIASRGLSKTIHAL